MKHVTPASDIEDAIRICSILKIDSEKIYINKPKNSFLEIIKHTDNMLLTGNLVARIRMCMSVLLLGLNGKAGIRILK